MSGSGQTLRRARQAGLAQGERNSSVRPLFVFLLSLSILLAWNWPILACSIPINLESSRNSPQTSDVSTPVLKIDWSKISAPCGYPLSQEQKKKITDLHKKFHQLAAQLKPQINTKLTEIKRLLTLPEPPAAQIRQLLSEKLTLESQLQKAAFDNFQAMKKLLTPEQQAALLPCGCLYFSRGPIR